MDAEGAKSKKASACPKCGGRLRLRPDQVGTEVKCPKCNAVFTVGRPAAPPPAPVSPEDAYEPEIPLKRSTIVHEPAPTMIEIDERPEMQVPIEPYYTPTLVQPQQYDADWSRDDLEAEAPHQRPPSAEPDYLELAHKRGLVRTAESTPPPDWLFFSGVFTFPWRGPNAARWTVMAVLLTLAGEIGLVVVNEMAGSVSLSGPVLVLVASVVTVMTLTFCAACFMAAVDDTVDGQDEMQDSTFPPWDEWFPALFSVFNVVLMSGAVGYPLALVPQIGFVGIPVSALVLFPVLFLSAMECGSYFAPLSPVVWRTIPRFFGTWLAFYVISTLLIGGWLAGTAALLPNGAFLVVLGSAAALAAVVLIYARLLGRLGWRISTEFSPDDGPAGTSPPRGRRKRKKRRKRGSKLKFPDELALPGGMPSDEPPATIDFHSRP